MLYGIFLSVITCFCWGSTAFLLRGIRGLDASEMSLMRSCGGLVCAVGLVSLVQGANVEQLGASEALVFIALVLCNNVIGDVFLFFALHRLGVARGSAIASSSLVSEWVKGKTLDEASQLTNAAIAEELALPPVKIHCSILAEDAIKAAIRDYRSKQEKKE